MEKFQELRENAKKKINIADHILTQTYPIIQDPKLLLAVLENIFLALTNGMGSILYYERLFKRIPPFHDNFDSKFNMFSARIVNRHKIDRKHSEMIRDVKSIIVQHRQSPIEFSRKDKLIICNDNYDMKTVSVDNIKEYVMMAKEFLNVADAITSKEEDIFNKN
jgi:hypothetical protein